MNKVNSMKNRIFLFIGFMASGKSYYGNKCAKHFGYNFIDLDTYIEKKESKTIEEIFATKGEDYFRKIESSYFKEILENINQDIIISVGGGFPLKNENQKLMKEAICIFIDTDFNIISKRLKNEELKKRPLLKNLDNQEIESLYNQRKKIYEPLSDYIINDYNTIIDVINKI